MIPSILLSPPWEKAAQRTTTKKKSDGRSRFEVPPIEDAIIWGKERGRPFIPWGSRENESPELDAEVEAEALRQNVSYLRLFDASKDVMTSLVEKHPDKVGGGHEGLIYLLAHVRERAIPFVLAKFRAEPYEVLAYVLSLQSAEIAPIAAEAWHKRKKIKLDGGRWLIRHPEVASLVLLPAAAGKKGKARDAALAALSLLEKEEAAAFNRAMDHYGEEARVMWKNAREEAPATGEPEKAPPSPAFLAEITPPRLRGDDSDLPDNAMKNLCGLLALSPHPEMHPSMTDVIKACTPESLADFARSLFEAWSRAGLPREHGYAARYAIHLGDDDLIAHVADLAEEWGSSGGYARAIWVADALAQNGSMTALAELDNLGRRARSWSLAWHARRRLMSAAETRGVSLEELADSLVPDLGIGTVWKNTDCVLALEHDQLVLQSPNGQRLKKPASGDDAKTQKEFSALSKQVRTLLSRQRARLEAAMLSGREWSGAAFAKLVANPVLGQLARRLVWISSSSTSSVAVRVAEDGSLADRSDTAVALNLEDAAALRVAHPVEIGAEHLDEWRARMSEYKIIEPFPQLGREVFFVSATRDDDDDDDDAEATFAGGGVVDAKKLAGVARRGWSAGEIEESGYIYSVSRMVRDAVAVLSLSPGLLVGAWSSSEPQEIAVSLSKPARLCPILFSEVRRDLEAMRRP